MPPVAPPVAVGAYLANDRIFIACNYCGERTVLPRWYPSTLFHIADVDRLQEWMDLNFYCRPRRLAARLMRLDLESTSGFDLETESGSGSGEVIPPV